MNPDQQEVRWDIESEYPELSSNAFVNDELFVRTELDQIKNRLAKQTAPLTVQQISQNINQAESAQLILANLITYVHCLLSVDGSRIDAKEKLSEMQDLASQLKQVLLPIEIFIQQCPSDLFSEIIKSEKLKAYEFVWTEKRKQKKFSLSENEEVLLAALENPGHISWSNLYDSLSSSIRCELKYPDRTETVGLAKAHALSRVRDPETRKIAWQSIQEAWTEHKQSSAAIINALAQWRIEVSQKRSLQEKKHYTDEALFQNRVTHETLDAIMLSCQLNASKIQKATQLIAKAWGKTQLDPWDLLAPSPISSSDTNISYTDACKKIVNAFAQTDKELSNFAQMAIDKHWIEGRVMDQKTTGGYCTFFSKSKEPRIFMTYMGSNNDVFTLAHELGHAYHSWTMRDLPFVQQEYPLTLAETASVFAETCMSHDLITNADSFSSKFEFAYNEMERASAFLLNIPMRFDFENQVHQIRQNKFISPDQLSQLMNQSWRKWYGDSYHQSDNMFWAHKLHFSIPGPSFYNFPYTFGYLFSLSLYARRIEQGPHFMKTYIEILRDTGRMTAEDLVAKHLNEDIRKPQFWQKAIDLILTKIDDFEKMFQHLPS
jgi:oligoendopeptidase F